MKLKSLSALSALLLTFGLACARGADDEVEGDDAGECSDQADNDLNGLFDCDEPACAGSPACDGTGGGDDTGDDGPYTGPTNIESATANCDNGSWWFDVYAVGAVGEAELYMAETGSSQPWWEFGHVFPATTASTGDSDTRGSHAADGSWSNPYMELDIVNRIGDVSLSSTTLMPCNSGGNDRLTFSIIVTDGGGAEADCVSWGDDPSSNVEGYDFGACDTL